MVACTQLRTELIECSYGEQMSNDRDNRDPLRTIRLMWDPPPAGSRGPKARLTVAEIVAAAISLADESGTEALSMRQVARALDCGTMSLYTYISSKAELLELMIDHVHAEISPPDEELDGRGQLFALALQQLSLYQRHPWILQSNLVRLALGPRYLDAAELQLQALERLGLSPEDIFQSSLALNSYVHGAARSLLLDDQAHRDAGVNRSTFEAARDSFWERYFDLERYPAHTRLWTFGGMKDRRVPFEFGLNRLLDGIEALRGS